MKKNRAQNKISTKNNKNKDWEKLVSFLNLQYTYKPSIEQGEVGKRQISEKGNLLEVSGAQYKNSKSLANKIGDTLAELTLRQSYDPIFLDMN